LKAHPKEVAPYEILQDAVSSVADVVLARLTLFNSGVESRTADSRRTAVHPSETVRP